MIRRSLCFFDFFGRKLLRVVILREIVTAFWGEQKAAEAIASAVFNFYGVLVFELIASIGSAC